MQTAASAADASELGRPTGEPVTMVVRAQSLPGCFVRVLPPTIAFTALGLRELEWSMFPMSDREAFWTRLIHLPDLLRAIWPVM